MLVYAIWKSKQSVKLTATAFVGSNPTASTILNIRDSSYIPEFYLTKEGISNENKKQSL